jgi:predicted phage baseplate assembly protein
VPETLLNSDRFAEHVVVETDNLGRSQLRFGTNEYGAMPDDESIFKVRYRAFRGAQGNIGADKLKYIVRHKDIGAMSNISLVRNPLPAWGGSPPESMQQVKRLAPAATGAVIKRAVTEDDYSRVTEAHSQVARAVAQFRWTGSWHTVFIRVDPKGTTELSTDLRERLVRHVSQSLMAGYDLEIIDPTYIPLELSLEICVEPGYYPSAVELAVLEVLSNRRLSDGRLGFFHPDQFTFGQPLYISKIYAAVEAAAGVQSVAITGLHQQYATEPATETDANLARGYIDVDDFAVLRLDNDPDFPENGILHLSTLGGNA